MAPSRLVIALLCAAAPSVWAQPKVCGNQAPLGDFAPAACPAMRDDGVAPDEVKDDGVFTLEVRLQPTELLKYKILPSGAYGPDEIRQVGDCGLTGKRDNPTGDILVPRPDVSQPARFYYDRNRRTGGDSLMTATPAGVAWVAVGGFQPLPFDPMAGTVDLVPEADGLLRGTATVSAPVGPGWQWKVLEKKGTYTDARKYGVNGWSVTPCDSDNAVVAEALQPGDKVELRFATRTGALTAQVMRGGRCCDDLPGGDLRAPPPTDAAPPPRDGGADLFDEAQLPGIRCDCRLAGRRAAPPPLALVLLGLLGLWARRRGRH